MPIYPSSWHLIHDTVGTHTSLIMYKTHQFNTNTPAIAVTSFGWWGLYRYNIIPVEGRARTPYVVTGRWTWCSHWASSIEIAWDFDNGMGYHTISVTHCIKNYYVPICLLRFRRFCSCNAALRSLYLTGFQTQFLLRLIVIVN